MCATGSQKIKAERDRKRSDNALKRSRCLSCLLCFFKRFLKCHLECGGALNQCLQPNTKKSKRSFCLSSSSNRYRIQIQIHAHREIHYRDTFSFTAWKFLLLLLTGNLCQRGRVQNKRPKAFFNMWKQQWKNATNSAHCVDILQCIQKEQASNRDPVPVFNFKDTLRGKSRVCAWGNYASLTLHKCCPQTRHTYNKMHQSEVQLSIHLLTFFPDSLLDSYTFSPHSSHTPSTVSFPFAFSVFLIFQLHSSAPKVRC